MATTWSPGGRALVVLAVLAGTSAAGAWEAAGGGPEAADPTLASTTPYREWEMSLTWEPVAAEAAQPGLPAPGPGPVPVPPPELPARAFMELAGLGPGMAMLGEELLRAAQAAEAGPAAAAAATLPRATHAARDPLRRPAPAAAAAGTSVDLFLSRNETTVGFITGGCVTGVAGSQAAAC